MRLFCKQRISAMGGRPLAPRKMPGKGRRQRTTGGNDWESKATRRRDKKDSKLFGKLMPERRSAEIHSARTPSPSFAQRLRQTKPVPSFACWILSIILVLSSR
jgi:hypothetical protein